MSKKCTNCNILLDFDKFRKVDKRNKTYYRNICKKCVVSQRSNYHKYNYKKKKIKPIEQSLNFPKVIVFMVRI